MVTSSVRLNGGKSSWPRTMTSTFSARKPLKGAATRLASIVKVKKMIASSRSTNSGQSSHSTKLAQAGRLGISCSSQPSKPRTAKVRMAA